MNVELKATKLDIENTTNIKWMVCFPALNAQERCDEVNGGLLDITDYPPYHKVVELLGPGRAVKEGESVSGRTNSWYYQTLFGFGVTVFKIYLTTDEQLTLVTLAFSK